MGAMLAETILYQPSHPAIQPAHQGPMGIDGVRALIADDMQAVDTLIGKRLHSEVLLINQVDTILLIAAANACVRNYCY